MDKKRHAGQAHSNLADETAPRKPSEYVVSVLIAFGIIAVLQWVTGFGSSTEHQQPESFNYEQAVNTTVAPSRLLTTLGDSLNDQFPELTTTVVNDDLLIRARDAVVQQDDVLFAETMTLLGVNALRDNDTDSAGVYLDEALSVYEFLDNELGIANVEHLRGELNIRKRADARRAAYAYDAMQIARWKVSHGQFHDAIAELKYAVNENLALQRYGAAAAVYQTLYAGYSEHGQSYQAQLAGIEIVRLHASSGRPLQAERMIKALQFNGLDEASAQQLKKENLSLQMDYDNSISQIGKARDYQQLYNHFIHAGDPVRAWQFRLKAQRSLSGASKRAMHRSQTGVLALLYTSNNHMRSASRSLNRAGKLFLENGYQTASDASTRLQQENY